MLRTEMLRAKSLQTEVSYLTEMRGVREAQQLAAKQHTLVTHRERAFWAEVVRERHTFDSQVAPAGPQITIGLDRLRQALGDLKQVKVQHAAVAETLQQRIGAVSKTQQRVEVLQEMVAKTVRLKRSAQDSRRADEIAEIATIGRSRGHGVTVRLCEEETQLAARLVERSEAPTPVPPQEILPVTPMQPRSDGFSRYTEVSSVPVEVRTIEHISEPHRSSLSVTCSIGNIGSIGMRLVKGEGDGVRAILDPTVGALAGRVVAERTAIVNRLQGLGVKLSSLEIGAGEGDGDNGHCTRRSKTLRVGDEYEDDLT